MSRPKNLEAIGDSIEVIRGFPQSVKEDIGFQLHLVQIGETPTDFRPMPEIGAGTYEVRVREPSGWYRAFDVTKFEEAIYLLHAFEKKTNTTSKKDKDIGKTRYRDMVQRRK
jgi:phage-related protein